MKSNFYEKMLDGAVKIYIKAVPNSSVLKFGSKLETGEIKVHLTEVPENGKANAQLLKFLSKYFHTSKVLLEKGESSKHKIVIVEKDITEILEKL